MNTEKYNNFLKNWTHPILLLLILILINIVSSYYFTRIDLTTEKKYSLSKETKQLIEAIDDIIYFKIYLHGDLPIEYKQLHQEVQYMLNELKAYSKYIEYEFIDPSSIANDEYKITLWEELLEKGISPIPHRTQENNKKEEIWIFPGLTVSYKSKEISVSLINESLMNDPNTVIKESVNRLEYLFINAIRNLTVKKEKIGLINGHGETTNHLIKSFKEAASEHYQVIDVGPINGQLNALNNINCIIINNPQEKFTEKEKFIIDQFIMRGGKSIWILSGTNANMDSLTRKNETLVMPIENRNLNDLLFKYGVRINNDLIQDLQASPIPIVTHYIEDQPQWTFFPWTFFPVISTNSEHLITTNINPVKSQFPSSIDTINNKIKKTILLKTTSNTKITNTPALVNLENLKTQPDELTFNHGEKNIAVLLSGEFESVFKNRIPLNIQEDANIKFKENTLKGCKYEIVQKEEEVYVRDSSGIETKVGTKQVNDTIWGEDCYNKMIIISDGNFIKNQFYKGQNLPVGFDKHTGKQYGNGEFMLNCIDYLLEHESFITIRSKNVDLRLLNKPKINAEKKYWQILNSIIPIIIILIIGSTLFIIRRKKYN